MADRVPGPDHRAEEVTPHPISWLTATRRRWLYGCVLAVVALLVVYGLISAEEAPVWVALAAAVLGTTTATAHVPKRSDKTDAVNSG